MTMQDYKKRMKKTLLPRTLVFLERGDEVMLGFKKKGFGKGYYLGIGGKVEKGETIKQATKREVEEEIHVNIVPAYLQAFGLLHFYFPHIADESWNMKVYVFLAKKWDGTPKESNEIKPEWYSKQQIPFQNMWDDARYWLPEILGNKKVKGEFIFDTKLKVTEYLLSSF